MTCVGQSNMQSSLVELSYFHWLVHGGHLHVTRNGVSSDLPRHDISKCNVFLSVLRLSAKVCFIVLISLLFLKFVIFQTDVIVELFYGIIKYHSQHRIRQKIYFCSENNRGKRSMLFLLGGIQVLILSLVVKSHSHFSIDCFILLYAGYALLHHSLIF